MSTKANCVIVKDGKFLASAFLPARGKANARWVEEYPDAALYTLGEADSVQVRLKDAGIRSKVVRDYGLVTEQEFAS